MMRAAFLTLLCCALATAALAAKPVYKWKDADGGLHFTDTPPPAGAILIKGPPAPSAAATPTLPVTQPPCPAQGDQAGCSPADSAAKAATAAPQPRRDDQPAH